MTRGADAMPRSRAEPPLAADPGFDLRLLVSNTGWLLASQAVFGVGQFARSAMIARYLGPEQYGHWGYAVAFVSLFFVFADLGLSTLAVRDLARGEKAGPYLGTAAVLKLGASVALFALLFAVEPLANSQPEARALVYLMGAQTLFASANLLVQAVFRAAERMHIEAAINIAQSVALIGVIALLIAGGASATDLALAYLVASAFAAGASLAVLVRGFLPRDLRFDAAIARRLGGDLWPVGTALALTSVYYFADRLIMGALGQAEALGWYTAAYAPVLWISGLVGVLRGAFMPAQTRALSGRGGSDVLRLYRRVSLVCGVGVALGGLVFAGVFLELAYGASYLPGAFALRLLSLTAGVMFLSSCYGSDLLVLGRQRLYLAGVGLGAAINIALNLVLIPSFSLDGAATATLVSEAVVMAFMWRFRAGARRPAALREAA